MKFKPKRTRPKRCHYSNEVIGNRPAILVKYIKDYVFQCGGKI